MYHIKRDARSQRSAGAIIAGLEARLEIKPFQDLSVTEVCAAAGVGRTTFYRHFDNLTDVLAYQTETLMRLFENSLKTEGGSVRDACLAVTREWMCHVNLLKALVEGKHFDLLMDASLRHRELLRARAQRTQVISREEFEYMMNFLPMSLPLGLLVWYRTGKKETPEELIARLKKSHLFIARLL